MKAVSQKEWKSKKRYLMFNFHWQKCSQQRKTARYCKTPMKRKIVSFGSYFWLFLPDFPQKEIACWNSMLVKSAGTVSRELHWGKRVYIGLTCG